MDLLARARAVLIAEAEAISNLPLDNSFKEAITSLVLLKGKLITTGIGKAGHVAQKAASTFCTTGTPSAFLHPGDASHGDVGVLSSEDILLAYSNSGRTREILETVEFCKKLKVRRVISITAETSSPLAQVSDIVLKIGRIIKPCPLGLTPTASVAAMLAIGDALALVVMQEKGITHEDFAIRHHGGYLGEKCRVAL